MKRLLILLILAYGPLAAQTNDYPVIVKENWNIPVDAAKLFVEPTVKCKKPKEIFIVSIPGAQAHWETCATSRLDALMSLSPTVWTEKEWDEAVTLFKEPAK